MLAELYKRRIKEGYLDVGYEWKWDGDERDELRTYLCFRWFVTGSKGHGQ